MNPIETLSNEHGLIRRYLDNLSLAAEKIEGGEYPPREFFEQGIDFARSFTDKYHHFKEEHVLFLMLAQKKSGKLDGQIEALRFQHERGRNLISGIELALDGYEQRKQLSVADLLENLSSYISMLRHHIHTEDHVFYPLAQNELSQDEFTGLQGEFNKAREKYGDDTFETYHKSVVDMGSMIAHM